MVYGHLGAAMVFAMVNVSIQIALALVFLEWRLDKVNMLCIVLIQFQLHIKQTQRGTFDNNRRICESLPM
jgi:hypothetical protein